MIAAWRLYYKQNLSVRDRKRLSQATRIAETSQCNKRHGAVLTQGGRVLGTGVNINKNDAAIIGVDVTLFSVHAEVAAWKSAGSPKLHNATMYVARVSKRGKPVMSKPCTKCQEFLRSVGVRKVVYTIDSVIDI